MDPVSLVVGAALLIAGFLAGRVGRRRPALPPPPLTPVCGCGPTYWRQVQGTQVWPAQRPRLS